MHGGAADRSGLISVGDEVIEVNGVNVEGQTPNDVLKILVSLAEFKLLESDFAKAHLTIFSNLRFRKSNCDIFKSITSWY